MTVHVGLHLVTRQTLDAFFITQDGCGEGMALKKPSLKRFKNDISRLVSHAGNLIQNHIPFLVELGLGKGAVKRDVREQLEGTLCVFAPLRRSDPGVLLGGVGIDLTPHRFHPVQDVKRLALGRPLEEDVFDEVGQTRFPLSFVTRACIDDQRTMRHLAGHPRMDDAQAVGQNVGLEFRGHIAKVVGKSATHAWWAA